jgi:hypothetical protein
MEVVSKYVALADRGPVLVNHGKPASVPAPPIEDLITTVRDLARMPTETSTSVTQSLVRLPPFLAPLPPFPRMH